MRPALATRERLWPASTARTEEQTMKRLDGGAALELDFSGGMASDTGQLPGHGGRGRLRLALSSRNLRGPGKYKVLEHRLRQAQIRARHLLNLMEEAE
jgi:hypothetical protein